MEDTDILCPCLSGRMFGTCCHPYAQAPAISGNVAAPEARASLRRNLLELVRRIQGYMDVWFAFADSIPVPLHSALPDRPAKELEQARLELFFWDFFQQVSQARPILRVAHEAEPQDMRFSNRLDVWSLQPWEPFEALRHHPGNDSWDLRNLANGKLLHVHPAYEHHSLSKGDAFVARVLSHGGHSFTGLSLLRFPASVGPKGLAETWKELCTMHGLNLRTRLRPDVHTETWFSFHLSVMKRWAGLPDIDEEYELLDTGEPAPRAPAPPPPPPPDLDAPLQELGNQSPREASRHELGRHRLRRWLSELEAQGRSVQGIRKTLKIP